MDTLEHIKQNPVIVKKDCFDQMNNNLAVNHFILILVVFAIIYDVGLFISIEEEKNYLASFVIAFVIGLIIILYSLFVNYAVLLLSSKKLSDFRKTLQICIYSLNPIFLIGVLFFFVGLLDYFVSDKSPSSNLLLRVILLILAIPVVFIFANIVRGIQQIYHLSTLHSILAGVLIPFLMGFILLILTMLII